MNYFPTGRQVRVCTRVGLATLIVYLAYITTVLGWSLDFVIAACGAAVAAYSLRYRRLTLIAAIGWISLSTNCLASFLQYDWMMHDQTEHPGNDGPMTIDGIKIIGVVGSIFGVIVGWSRVHFASYCDRRKLKTKASN